jgi:hypothetical protein
MLISSRLKAESFNPRSLICCFAASLASRIASTRIENAMLVGAVMIAPMVYSPA